MLKEAEKNCTGIKKEKGKNNSNIDALRKKAQSDLESWRNELNEMKFDLSKWSEITMKTKKTMRELESAMKCYKTDLLGEDRVYKSKVEHFEYINLEYMNNRTISGNSIKDTYGNVLRDFVVD